MHRNQIAYESNLHLGSTNTIPPKTDIHPAYQQIVVQRDIACPCFALLLLISKEPPAYFTCDVAQLLRYRSHQHRLVVTNFALVAYDHTAADVHALPET